MAASFFNNKARAAEAASASSSKAKAATAAEERASQQPWVEKYRPRTLDEVKAQDHVVNILRRLVNASNLPHLLLYGPPGTGKTSTILALCRELFGPELFASRVLELNASDERGISVIRERVKGFAQQALQGSVSQEYKARYPCPPIRFIILDEADALNQDAQGALRRVMENYSKITRFCLIANFVSRIIDPISSRCSKFRFKALEDTNAQLRLTEILTTERVAYDEGVIEKTLKISDGDLRKAIQLLQSGSRLIGYSNSTNGSASKRGRKQKVVDDDDDQEMTDAGADDSKPLPKISVAMLDELAGSVPAEVTASLISAMRKGSAQNYNGIAAEITDIVASGYSANEVLNSLFSRLIVLDDVGVADSKKHKMCQVFSEVDKRLVDGSDEHLTLLDLTCQLAGVMAR